jgi:hypothetical protein
MDNADTAAPGGRIKAVQSLRDLWQEGIEGNNWTSHHNSKLASKAQR